MAQQEKYRLLLLDDWRGVEIPRDFAKLYPEVLTDSQSLVLLNGPDHEDYWEVWDEVIRNVEITIDKKRYTLDQDEGVLWAVEVDVLKRHIVITETVQSHYFVPLDVPDERLESPSAFREWMAEHEGEDFYLQDSSCTNGDIGEVLSE